MATLNIVSAGAAQFAVTQIADKFQRESGQLINATFGAVGAMKNRVLAGASADIVVLTSALIDELIRQGFVVPGSRIDLGKVATGVAVRAGTPLPDVRDTRVLRGNLLAATKIVCPDPAFATAGKVVLNALDRLGIAAEVRPRLQYFPARLCGDGTSCREHGMLKWASRRSPRSFPIRVSHCGSAPAELQNITIYSVGLARSKIDCSREFIRRLTGFTAQPLLSAAGFDIGH